MENYVDISSGVYCSHWGLTDLYDDCETKLRELIESGKDFVTNWCGSKKEIESARYSRCGDEFTVEVGASMDDMWESYDLFSDAVWEILHDPMYPLSKNVRDNLEYITETDMDDDGEKFVDCVTDMAIDAGIDDNATCSETISASDATYEKIMGIVEKLEDEAASLLNEYYVQYKNIVYESAKEYYADKELKENR